MIFADRPRGPPLKRVCSVDAEGTLQHVAREAVATLLRPGDLVVANDAATLPASLAATHCPTDTPFEFRLAGWDRLGDPSHFVALALGSGDHRIRTEDRGPPPVLAPGDRLSAGPLKASVEGLLGHPRLFKLRLDGSSGEIFAGLAHHGRPIQYSHVQERLSLWDVWTPIAVRPVAFEPPSAGFVLDHRLLASIRRRGIGFATVTHAAGVSSTGDPQLDDRLPLDEPYIIPDETAEAITHAKAHGGRVFAIGTTVVRALEASVSENGMMRPGGGIATGRIGRESRLRIVDAVLTGVHAPGESHYELLRAFANDTRLRRLSTAVAAEQYRNHEYGDFVLVERDHH